MPKRILGARGEASPDRSAPPPSAVPRSALIDQAGQQVGVEPRTDDRGGIQGAFGRAAEAVDAGGDGGLQSGRHLDVGDVTDAAGRRRARRRARRVRPDRARSPRRKTGSRRRVRRSASASARTDGSVPSSSAVSAAVCAAFSGASEIVCAPGDPRQRAAVFGAVGDQHQRRRLRDHSQEVGQHATR